MTAHSLRYGIRLDFVVAPTCQNIKILRISRHLGFVNEVIIVWKRLKISNYANKMIKKML